MARLTKKARQDGRCYLTVYVERSEMKELKDYCQTQGLFVSNFMRAEALKVVRGLKTVNMSAKELKAAETLAKKLAAKPKKKAA